jgi:hypothetical protein
MKNLMTNLMATTQKQPVYNLIHLDASMEILD